MTFFIFVTKISFDLDKKNLLLHFCQIWSLCWRTDTIPLNILLKILLYYDLNSLNWTKGCFRNVKPHNQELFDHAGVPEEPSSRNSHELNLMHHRSISFIIIPEKLPIFLAVIQRLSDAKVLKRKRKKVTELRASCWSAKHISNQSASTLWFSIDYLLIINLIDST